MGFGDIGEIYQISGMNTEWFVTSIEVGWSKLLDIWGQLYEDSVLGLGLYALMTHLLVGSSAVERCKQHGATQLIKWRLCTISWWSLVDYLSPWWCLFQYFTLNKAVRVESWMTQLCGNQYESHPGHVWLMTHESLENIGWKLAGTMSVERSNVNLMKVKTHQNRRE